MTLLYLPDTTAVLGSHSLSINCQGDRVLVGALSPQNAGAVFVLDATTGDLLQSLQPPCLQYEDYFGSSVAMNCDGSRALVGAKKNRDADPSIKSPGVVYLFDIIDNIDGSQAAVTVNLLQTFQNPNPQDYDEFGIVVAMDHVGETIAIASPNHNHNQGIVYLFNKNGRLIRSLGPPSLLASTTANDSNANTAGQARNANNHTEHNLHRDQFFGSSLALSEDSKLLLVGAPGKGWTKQLPGAVYLFDTHTGDLLQTIHNPAHNYTQVDTENVTNVDYYFASAVAMSSNASTLVVGAMLTTQPPLSPPPRTNSKNHQEFPNSGLVHIFNQNGDLLQTLTSPNNNHNSEHTIVNDHFGISVSVTHDGDQILVGAPHSNEDAENTAATKSTAIAFLFDNSGNLLRSMYNPTRAAADHHENTTRQQPPETIQFGGAVTLASSGKYAAISSAFHPVVEVACLHSNCPVEEGPSEFKPMDDTNSESIPLVAYDSNMCLVSNDQVARQVQLGGNSKSKLSPAAAALTFLAVVTLLGILLVLRKVRRMAADRRQHQEPTNPPENLMPVAVPSPHSFVLPEIL